MRLYVKVVVGEEVSATATIEIPQGLSHDMLIFIAHGLLYEADWTQVAHAIYYKKHDGTSYECIGSFNKDGEEDNSVQDYLYSLCFKED